MMPQNKAYAASLGSAIVKSGSTSLLTTPNGNTIKQDASGNMGIYNTAGVEIAYFDVNGNLVFPYAGTPLGNGQSIGIAGDGANLFIQSKGLFTFRSVGGNNVLQINSSGVCTKYNIGRPTAGAGISAIYANYSQLAKIAAVTNAVNFTPPAAAGTYRLSWIVDVNASVTHSFTVVASWKDASGNATSQTLGGSDDGGSALVAGAITNALGVGVYYGSVLIQIDNSATPITLSTVGVFTSVTYNLAATLEQLA
jgi:hypothetical protein